MARVNNLTNFLNDVSAAIKQKIGDNTPISAAEFDTKIMEIETVGNYQDKTLTITTNGNYRLEPDTNFDAISSVVITANVPTEDLEAEISAQEEYIAQLEAIIDTKAVGSGDGSSMNIFVQLEEPETKKGIWLQKEAEPEHYTCDEEVFIGGTWEPDGKYKNNSMPANSFTASVGNKIYIFRPDSSDIYVYDQLLDTYTKLNVSAPSYGYYIRGATIGTDIYFFNGNLAYKFNTLNYTFTQLANAPINLQYGISAASVGTDIYLLSGDGGTSSTYNYKYDTLTDTYTQMASIPYRAKGAAAVSIGTSLYIIGGDYYNSNTPYMYQYNTLNNTWTRKANIPYSFYYSSNINRGATIVGTDIYVFGGELSACKKNAYKYDTVNNTWTQLDNIPYEFAFGSAITINNKIYLICNNTNGKTQVYVLESKTYEQDNLVVINQGKYKTSGHEVELFCNNKMITQPKYPFVDAWYYTLEGGLETDIPSYYGDGTQWINFKNPPVEEVEE